MRIILVSGQLYQFPRGIRFNTRDLAVQVNDHDEIHEVLKEPPPADFALVTACHVSMHACQPKPHRGWVFNLILSTLPGEVNVALNAKKKASSKGGGGLRIPCNLPLDPPLYNLNCCGIIVHGS